MNESAIAFPSLSVVIPTWNRAALLSDAIDSVREQGHPALELIVVDDGSTDETPALLRARNDVDAVIHQSNAGPAAARNAGIRRARGEWIGFLDSDDLWMPDALNLHAAAIAEHGAHSIVLGDSRFEGVDGSAPDPARMPVEKPPIGVSLERCRFLQQLHLGSTLFSRVVFDQVGLLDVSLRFYEDTEFFLRIETTKMPVLRHDGLVHVIRIHDRNMTQDTGRTLAATPRFLRRVLELRRGRRNRVA